MSEPVKTALASLGALVVTVPAVFVLTIAGTAWRSYWLYPAWNWFAVPLGVPSISFWHFAALTLLTFYFTNTSDEKKDDRPHDWYRTLAAFVLPILLYFVLKWMHGR